jgi:CheY-like chemotaxis protein
MTRVLYVEDHADTREAVSRMLEHAGYEVCKEENGREALMAAIGRPPDVMLLDLGLPEMNGVQLVQVIRTYHRLCSIPVVVLTALSSGKLFEEAKALNVSSFLIKPMATFDHIRAAVEEALAHPRSDAGMQSPEKWRSDSISPL